MMGLVKHQRHANFEIVIFSRCKNIEGKRNNFLELPNPGPRLLFVRMWFYDGPWQTAAACEFYVASYSRCKNIKREHQIFRSFPNPRTRSLFALCAILWCVSANPSCVSILNSLAWAVALILKGNLYILGNSPSPGPCPLFLWCALANPSCMPNLKSLTSAVGVILVVNPNFEEFPQPRATPLCLLGVILWWALANWSCHLSFRVIWWWALVTPAAYQIWNIWRLLLRKHKGVCVFQNLDKQKWGTSYFFGKLTLPLDLQTQCFFIQCTTFAELWLQKMGEFYKNRICKVFLKRLEIWQTAGVCQGPS